MGRLIWSSSALEDAESIAHYTSRDSKDRAALFVTRLFETAEQLKAAPEIGRVIPEINEQDARELFVSPYRLMYRIQGEEVWITAIVHGARDLPNPPSR